MKDNNVKQRYYIEAKPRKERKERKETEEKTEKKKKKKPGGEKKKTWRGVKTRRKERKAAGRKGDEEGNSRTRPFLLAGDVHTYVALPPPSRWP